VTFPADALIRRQRWCKDQMFVSDIFAHRITEYYRYHTILRIDFYPGDMG
jgi:hypothetical protein